jgi:hypothetical protein
VAPALIGRTLFDERLPGGIAGGEGRQVILRQVSIEPRRRDIRIDNLPETGMLLAQLQAGGLATVINGERRIRLEGEWWTVSPPSAMRLETRDDTVVIDLVLILD